MKTILVPAGGSDTDDAVFRTALAVARPLNAHLEFLHVRIGPCEAAFYTPHVDFARGEAIAAALTSLQRDEQRRTIAAAKNFSDFCKRSKIEVVERPGKFDVVTANFREEENDAMARITLRARHNDLVVVGRAPRANGLPVDFLEQLLLVCGRPVLIAPESPPRKLATVMVCWKETPEAARAVTAALPLLEAAKLVVFVGAAEDGEPSLETLRDVARQMEWHGIRTKAHLIEGGGGKPAADRLARAAKELGADLMVMGGYGRSRARELVFGGCTQSVLAHAEVPVFLLH